jgi:serine/threonine protein kinase
MERVGRGNLRQVLTSERYSIPTLQRHLRGWALEVAGGRDRVSSLARVRACPQVAEAMAFVHSNDVIHYDLKTQNVLVGMTWHVRLCDFSHSIYVGGGDLAGWGQVCVRSLVRVCRAYAPLDAHTHTRTLGRLD